jgi:DMSO/TMAO reductase YedYZ molybdopterin-dependent catalytic subunit
MGTRRKFLKSSIAFSTVFGAEIVFSRYLPSNIIPIALADDFPISGKDGLTILNDRPISAETPAHLLNDEVTPASRLFVRNNGLPPTQVDASSWTLMIDGESAVSPLTFSLQQLQSEFETIERQITLECGGNGRFEFDPPAKGNQWTYGAVGCPRWQGIRLADVLKKVGVKDDAIYLAYYPIDKHLSQIPGKLPISRGVPIEKALQKDSMIVFGMNGEPLPAIHGYPLRLMFGGWPGSTSGKWVNHIAIRNKVHDGPKMTGSAYRVPTNPVAPGTRVADEEMKIIESMPVKSLITSPQSGVHHPLGQALKVNGHAWAGESTVKQLFVSIDFGQSWQKTRITKPANKYAWQHFDATVDFPKAGYFEVWARAVDADGVSQPMVLPDWNPKGYLNNACHRIAVYVA